MSSVRGVVGSVATVGAVAALGVAFAGGAGAVSASVEAPSIQGKVRFNSTVTCRPGTWSGDPVSFAYRWLLGGGPLLQGRDRVQATGPTLRLSEPGIMNGNDLSCEVTATDAAGATATARSAAIEPRPGLVTMRLTKVTSLPKGAVRIQGIVRPLVALGEAGSDNNVVVRRRIRPNTFVQLSLPVRVRANGSFVVVARNPQPGRQRIQVDFSVQSNRSSLWSDAQVTRVVVFTKGGTSPFAVRAG